MPPPTPAIWPKHLSPDSRIRDAARAEGAEEELPTPTANGLATDRDAPLKVPYPPECYTSQMSPQRPGMSRGALVLSRILVVGCLVSSAAHGSILLESVYDSGVAAFSPGDVVIGLTTAGGAARVFTIGTFFESPLYNGSLSYTRREFAYSPVMFVNASSLVAANPSIPDRVFISGRPVVVPINLLYTLFLGPPTSFSAASFGPGSTPAGLASDASGVVYMSRSAAIEKYSVGSDPTIAPSLTFGTSGAGTLNSPSALALGPDGLLYVVDAGNNRIAAFNTDGDFISDFDLLEPVDPSAVAIGSNGWMYLADGNGGGDIYDIYTGTLLGSFQSSALNNPTPGSRTSLALDEGHLYLYDANSGLHVFEIPTPEPATGPMLFLAGGAVLVWRRLARSGDR
jgi:DNA-binding beta-propeller fold protein YncE